MSTIPDPFKMMSDAMYYHRNQSRRYTDDPYHVHLGEVAGILSTIVDDLVVPEMGLWTHHLKCVAWGHDLLEDTDCTFQYLQENYGEVVAHGILLLSDHTDIGNRATRKAAATKRLAAAPGWVQSIKVADVLSNIPSIFRHDRGFAPLFGKEVLVLLDALPDSHQGLRLLTREKLGLFARENRVSLSEF